MAEDLVAGAGRVDVGHPLTDPRGELAERTRRRVDDLAGSTRIRQPDAPTVRWRRLGVRSASRVSTSSVSNPSAAASAAHVRRASRRRRRPWRRGWRGIAVGGGGGPAAGACRARLRSRSAASRTRAGRRAGTPAISTSPLPAGRQSTPSRLGELVAHGGVGTRRRRCAWPGTGPGRRAPTSGRQGRG